MPDAVTASSTDPSTDPSPPGPMGPSPSAPLDRQAKAAARRRRARWPAAGWLARRRQASPPPSIADDMIAEIQKPRWLTHADEVTTAGLLQMLRRLPNLVRQAGDLAWEAGPGATVTVVTLQFASGCIAAFGLLATTSALQPLLAVGPTPERVRAALPSLLLVGGALTLRALLDTGVAAASGRLSPRVGQVAEARLLTATVHADLAAFDDPEFYDALRQARDRGARTAQGVLDQVVALISSTVALLAVVGVLGVLHPLLLPLLGASVIPPSWAALRNARRGYASWTRLVALRRRRWMLSALLSHRQEAPELRAFTAQPYFLAEHERVAGIETAEEVRIRQVWARESLIGQAAGGLGLGATYLALGLLLSAGTMPLAVAGTAVLAIRSGRGALTQLVTAVGELYEEGLYMADYGDYLKQARGRARRVVGRRAPAGFDRIEVRDVSFTYPGKDQPALDGVSLTIHRHEVIALVGENGSGKTTLAKLLAGLYDPQAGSIRWDGVDLAGVDSDSIADKVAVVLQEPARWPTTARANITIGRYDRHDPDGEALRAASRDAGADEVIAELSAGYDTLLSREFKNGADLSGGQWQRMAVARGFYRDAPLLICDEPTANLDAKAEHAVYESIRQLARGRTIVLITHRLASTRTADRIYVLDRGRVVEQGTHGELMAAAGAYAGLYTLQAAAYQDATPDGTPDRTPDGRRDGRPDGTGDGAAAAAHEDARLG